LERGPHFPFPWKSFLISKFERTFETIQKIKRDCKQTLKIFNFKKPRRQVGPSEQVDPIFISNSKEDLQKYNLQQQQ
jgi:hypothetical protein